jgi:hypothetical protein
LTTPPPSAERCGLRIVTRVRARGLVKVGVSDDAGRRRRCWRKGNSTTLRSRHQRPVDRRATVLVLRPPQRPRRAPPCRDLGPRRVPTSPALSQPRGSIPRNHQEHAQRLAVDDRRNLHSQARPESHRTDPGVSQPPAVLASFGPRSNYHLDHSTLAVTGSRQLLRHARSRFNCGRRRASSAHQRWSSRMSPSSTG